VENTIQNSLPEKYSLILFIAGMSPKSVNAIENLRRICDKYLPGNFELEIIDININKEQAVSYEIIGIPTLIKTSPNPKRILIGDLSDTSKVLSILDLN